MGQADRDYWKTGYDKGLHPPTCTCVKCNEARTSTGLNDKQYERTGSNTIAIIVVIVVIIALITLAVWGLYVFDVL